MPAGPDQFERGIAQTFRQRHAVTFNEGPIARTITFFGCVPVTMNPPMSTLSPPSTRRRVEILPRWLE